MVVVVVDLARNDFCGLRDGGVTARTTQIVGCSQLCLREVEEQTSII